MWVSQRDGPGREPDEEEDHDDKRNYPEAQMTEGGFGVGRRLDGFGLECLRFRFRGGLVGRGRRI